MRFFDVRGARPIRAAEWIVPLGVLAAYLVRALKQSFLNPSYKNSYNLVVDTWLAGRLHIEAGLDRAFLADPYNFLAHVPYILSQGIIDLSIYEGKLYSYFGAAPAAVLYLPYRLVTWGQRLPDKAAVFLFCAGGYLFASAFLLHVRRRHFPATPAWIVQAALAVLGLANLAPMLIRLSNVYEVAISAASFFFMASLYALVTAFGENGVSKRRFFWAGLCAGLAAASRPQFALAASVCLLAAGWALYRQSGATALRALKSFAAPFSACLAALALHNWARFGNPFEFGSRYQISPLNQMGQGILLDPSRSLLSAYLFLFQPPVVDAQYPFFHAVRTYPVPYFHWPAGTYQIDTGAVGLVAGVPFLLVFLFGPLLVWVSRARGAAACAGPGSPFRAALRDTFLLYLGLLLASKLLVPFRNGPLGSEAALFVDRAAGELPLCLAFLGILCARLFRALRSAAPEAAVPVFPRFEASLLAASFLVLFSVATLHQNVNLRYPADFASLAILAGSIVWFYCDACLRGSTALRLLLGVLVAACGALSVMMGLARAVSSK